MHTYTPTITSADIDGIKERISDAETKRDALNQRLSSLIGGHSPLYAKRIARQNAENPDSIYIMRGLADSAQEQSRLLRKWQRVLIAARHVQGKQIYAALCQEFSPKMYKFYKTPIRYKRLRDALKKAFDDVTGTIGDRPKFYIDTSCGYIRIGENCDFYIASYDFDTGDYLLNTIMGDIPDTSEPIYSYTVDDIAREVDALTRDARSYEDARAYITSHGGKLMRRASSLGLSDQFEREIS